ncbi:hypothetical protein PT974_05067 [Cladobotryum mycophilum]|uniref:Uncharacterized protein n=1 Tax=Cladobotryum mycophilum TaxID=491253 RepID=A0ABR0SQY8_9HYPO
MSQLSYDFNLQILVEGRVEAEEEQDERLLEAMLKRLEMYVPCDAFSDLTILSCIASEFVIDVVTDNTAVA